MNGLHCYKHRQPWVCAACLAAPDADGVCGACHGSRTVEVYLPGTMSFFPLREPCPKCATEARPVQPGDGGELGCCLIFCGLMHVLPCAVHRPMAGGGK